MNFMDNASERVRSRFIRETAKGKRILNKLLVGYELEPEEEEIYRRYKQDFDRERKNYVSMGRYTPQNNPSSFQDNSAYQVHSRRHRKAEGAVTYPDAIKKAKCFLQDARVHGEPDIVEIEFGGRTVKRMAFGDPKITARSRYAMNPKRKGTRKLPKYLSKAPYSEWKAGYGDPVIQDIVHFQRKLLMATRTKKRGQAKSALESLVELEGMLRRMPEAADLMPRLSAVIRACLIELNKVWPSKFRPPAAEPRAEYIRPEIRELPKPEHPGMTWSSREGRWIEPESQPIRPEADTRFLKPTREEQMMDARRDPAMDLPPIPAEPEADDEAQEPALPKPWEKFGRFPAPPGPWEKFSRFPEAPTQERSEEPGWTLEELQKRRFKNNRGRR